MERLIRRYDPPESVHVLLVPFIDNLDMDGLRTQLRISSALDDLTVRELRVIGSQNGILNYSRLSKEELIGVIHAARESCSLVGEDEVSSPESRFAGSELQSFGDVCQGTC